MAGNEERPVIEAARPNLGNMTLAIVKIDITGDGESQRAIKQKAVGVIDLDDFSTMRAYIEKLANQMNRMTMHQTQQMQHVQHIFSFCELCGDGHMSDMCPMTPKTIYYVGQQSIGPMNQHVQYGNIYNPNWKSHPNFSQGGNQPTQNHNRPQGNFIQPQKPPKQIEESSNDLLKKLFLDNQQLRTNFGNLERQMGNWRELEEVLKKRMDKPIPEGELIPKATYESNKDDSCSKLVNVARSPPPFPQILQKKNDDRKFNKFLSMLRQQLGLGSRRPTTMMLQLADRYIAYSEGVIEDMLLQIGKFIFLVDFIIQDYKADEQVPIILGQPLLATCDAIIKEEKMLRVLRERKRAIGWTMFDIRGISPAFCKHKIPMEDGHEPNEKYHYMVREGIVLGHKVSKNGLRVDKARVEAIEKLPPPTSVKGICSFLGHASFYRRFIKDSSKISSPFCRLLEKYIPFKFYDACLKEFEELK
ncbi:uncharacterized protein [Nicotiana sylvestris]|uniref:uncharacterized protein n=1 Tax=Nicotiana sylvestris TaxID=4096 RepID=UPI00388CAE4C